VNDLTARQYIATQAMKVLLNKFNPNLYPIDAVVRDSFAVADAMLQNKS
jgi:hypothetical protein